MNRYSPSEIPVLSAPVTSANLRNAMNQPVTELGSCTPFQLFSAVELPDKGAVCIIGGSNKALGIAKALIRRSRKPFLLIGPEADRTTAFSDLNPEWIVNAVQQSIPANSGAILLPKPGSLYMELCDSIEEWGRDHFILLHLSGGLQIGFELLNILPSLGQCLIICDSIPQSIRMAESQTLSSKEFMTHMSCLIVFSAGVATKDLIDVLPTYQYEKITNATAVNSYRGRSIFHPLRVHRGHGISASQTRTTEFKKNLFEMDDLQKMYEDGTLLIYNAKTNETFLTELC